MKVGVAYMNICVSKYLKGELAWATDKRLWVISSRSLFKIVITTKKLKNKTILTCNIVCIAM